MSFSNYLENAVLNHVFGGTPFTVPTTLYVGLSTTSINDTGVVTEPSGSGYARVAVANNTTNFPITSNGVKNNATIVTFPESIGNWGTITDFFIADASTAGNILIANAVNVQKLITEGDTVLFGANSITINLD